MSSNILELKNIRKIYHDKSGETLALDNINLEVLDKEFISIIGPSGCGKSTLLGIIAGIIDKSGGEIITSDNFRIGYMLQDDCFSSNRLFCCEFLGLIANDASIFGLVKITKC